MKKIRIQIRSIKCQYKQVLIILIKLLFINLFLVIIRNKIIINPIVTWFIWKEVKIKKLVINIEFLILKFIIKYSKIWIKIKYIPKFIVMIINLLFDLFFIKLILMKIVNVILLDNRIIKFNKDNKKFNLNIFK